MEGIVDRPGDAMAEEKEEKDDADVFENRVNDLYLALLPRNRCQGVEGDEGREGCQEEKDERSRRGFGFR